MSPTFDITPEKRATHSQFLKRQLFREPPLTSRKDADLIGKTAIITGSNTGLGFECAKQLLDLGLSKLVVAVRNETKGEAAKEALLVGRDAAKHTVEVWKLDMSDYESILSFADRAKSLDSIHILINNAGISKRTFDLNSKTGHEETVQVNFLSCALLTILFLPILKDKNTPQEPGHVVIVTSDTPSWAKFKEKDHLPLLAALDNPALFDWQDRYPTSKLLGQFFISELTKRIPPTVSIINAPNPGMCKSSLTREFKGSIEGFIFGLVERILARTVSVGARALTDAAVNQGPESHGIYIEDGKLQPWAPLIYKPEGQKIAEMLWQETMDALAFARVSEIIKDLSG